MNKIKGWTAYKAVKIICFILICALCFTTVYSAYSFFELADEGGVSPDIVFADLSTYKYFHDRHMNNAYYQAMTALYYENEEAIKNGDYLKWEEYSGDGFGSELTTPDGSVGYAWIEYSNYGIFGQYYNPQTDEWRISISDDTLPPELIARRHEAEQNAISQQLSEYRAALEFLQKADGLVYYLSGPSGVVPGSITADSDRFIACPVYFIRLGNDFRDSSHDADFSYWYRIDYGYNYNDGTPDNSEIFLDFTSDFVNAQNTIYREAQIAYRQDFIILGACLLLMLLLTVILLLGAGRRRVAEGTESGVAPGVHFAFIDRPFLDISLAFLIAWCAIVVVLINETFYYLNRNSTPAVIITFLTAMSIAFVVPVLLWLLSFAKRVKAGNFWKHTLIYFIPSRCWRLLKSLWAGWPLTAKVAAIAFTSLMLMLTVVAATEADVALAIILSLFLTAAVTFLLLRYAVRIRKLKEGAIAVAGGDYDLRIDAGGGELGSIAHSINNISAGINTAVEERMKSERLKTELITNVSHDIRTPLTSIITYTDLLKNEGLDTEQAPEYLDILVQKSQRLKTLTDELFEAAKAASGNIDVDITELDIVSLINQVLGELDSAIGESGLNLRVNLPSSLLVKADGKLMWRVMENLLSNAFKYSLPGSRAYLDAVAEGSMARIDLKNISAQELNFDPSELTERFKRGDESRADGGSGLGLSIVQSFILAQGGKFVISIDGDLFKATTYLPLR